MMNINTILLASLIGLFTSTASAGETNVPDLLTDLLRDTSNTVKILDQGQSSNLRGQSFQFAGDRTIFCRHNPGKCDQTWERRVYWGGQYIKTVYYAKDVKRWWRDKTYSY